MGQFERTLIVVDEGASVYYIEGCTVPTFQSSSLQADIVEIIVKKDACCRYTIIQNWSDNVYNLVTKRVIVDVGGALEWIDGHLGAKTTIKSKRLLKWNWRTRHHVFIAMTGAGQNQDTGAKMIHKAPNTSSQIVFKFIAHDDGEVNYRGQVTFGKNYGGSISHIECDTISFNEIHNGNVSLEHEAKVSKNSEEQLYYLMSCGLTEEAATEMFIMGFVEPFYKELLMEYAVELNRLIAYEMEGSVG